MKYFFILLFLGFNITYAQTNELETTTLETATTNTNTVSFVEYIQTDSRYVGWQNPRANISRFQIFFNINFHDALYVRNPLANNYFDFRRVSGFLSARFAKELYFYRNPLFGIGVNGALELSSITLRNPISYNIYNILGQAGAFVDFFLPHDIKLRLIPLSHENTHIADGYPLDKEKDFTRISYEFIAMELYYFYKGATFYTGFEYTIASRGERCLLTRWHFGIDYQYYFHKSVGFITGINVGVLFDKPSSRHADFSGFHPAVNFGLGFVFNKLMTVSFDLSYQNGSEASTYHYTQFSYALEFGFLY